MTPLSSPQPSPDEAAAAWFARSRSGALSLAEQQALQDWLAEDPSHAAAYETCTLAWTLLEDLRAVPQVLAMREDVRGMNRSRWYSTKGAIAAGIVALVTAGTVFLSHPKPAARVQFAAAEQATDFATGVGQISKMRLPDGSQVLLDADSALALHFDATQRNIALERGRAYFHVAHEARPFIVTASRFSVQATGTQFVVDRLGGGETVSMVEGRVIARPLKPDPTEQPVALVAGKQLVASGHGHWLISPVDVNFAQDWMKGQLNFNQTRVTDIAEEANRYSRQKIVLADPHIASQRVSAVLTAGDIDTLVASLVDVGVAKVSARSPDAIVLATP